MTAKTPVSEQARLELALPAQMMVLLLEDANRIGYVVRADLWRHLNVAAATALSGLDNASISRLARRIDADARTLLNALSPDDPIEGLYACAMFSLLLLDEGKIVDRHNQAVLCSLLLIDDAKDSTPDVDGNQTVAKGREAAWKKAAGNLLTRANLLGYYLRC